MNELNRLFRDRIGMPEEEVLDFEGLDRLLEKTAGTFPFENLRVLNGSSSPISEPYLINKLLLNQEGGLCYELNSLLYLFLVENGLNVVLTRGVNYDREAQQYLTLGKTHIVVLLTHRGQLYLVDTGFGANLPLKPIPLTGETVVSDNGSFRIRPEDGNWGDCRLEVQIKNKDSDWHIGYAFDTGNPIDLSASEDVRKLIIGHPLSKFNKRLLATQLTASGNITLTNDSFTEWKDGIVTKETIDGLRCNELLHSRFGLDNDNAKP